VADIVEGVTKIGKIKFKNLKEAQAENFRKLILATARDRGALKTYPSSTYIQGSMKRLESS